MRNRKSSIKAFERWMLRLSLYCEVTKESNQNNVQYFYHYWIDFKNILAGNALNIIIRFGYKNFSAHCGAHILKNFKTLNSDMSKDVLAHLKWITEQWPSCSIGGSS